MGTIPQVYVLTAEVMATATTLSSHSARIINIFTSVLLVRSVTDRQFPGQDCIDDVPPVEFVLTDTQILFQMAFESTPHPRVFTVITSGLITLFGL